MSGPPRAAIYARISRPDESETYVGPDGRRGQPILENQVDGLRSYCKERGFLLSPGAEYVEIASGDGTRPVFDRLLHDVALQRGRPFDLVVFTALSRMTRGGIEAALHVLRVLEANGVGWHLIEQPVLNNDANTPPLAKDIILAVLSAVDRDYRRRISAATKGAYAKRKSLAEARGEKVRWGRPPGSKTRTRKSVPPITSGLPSGQGPHEGIGTISESVKGVPP